MLGVGLLGAGRIGNVHAKAISTHPHSKLVAVSDVNAEAAVKLAGLYGAEARSNEAIIDDPSIGAVLIATSTNTHSDLIEAATRAGKAVLCEKPVDLSLARAQACLKAAGATGRPVMIGFNRRFDPNFAALKAAADGGEIGKRLAAELGAVGEHALDAVALDGAGRDRVGADAEFAKLHRQRLGEADHAPFGGGVGAAILKAVAPGHRRHVDDHVALSLSDHCRAAAWVPQEAPSRLTPRTLS